MATSLPAQTLRSGVVLNKDSCYRYSVDTIPEFGELYYNVLATNIIPLAAFYTILTLNVYDYVGIGLNNHLVFDMSVKYPARGGTTVYGIAVTAREPLWENMYLDLSTCDTNLSVRRLGSASYADPHISGKYMYEAYTRDGRYENLVTPAYEYYFDQPVHLEDSFFVGIRLNLDYTSFDPYDYRSPLYYQMAAIQHLGQTLFHISNIVHDSIFSYNSIDGLGYFFPIVKLPCPAPDPPVLQANVPGLTILHLGDDEGVAYQVVVYNDAGDTVLLSDTTSNPRFVFSAAAAERWYEARVRSVCTYSFSGSDTLAYSRWSEPRRFYYSPDTTAITPFDLQPTTLDLHPNPATGWVSVAVPEACIGATLQLLDLEGRLLQDIKVLTSKFEIDLSSLPPGVYLLRSHGTTQRIVKK